jgi:hypothetical protein
MEGFWRHPLWSLPFDVEEFWDDLLAFIEDRSVIPVVGSELVSVEIDGSVVPLYRAIAERLLAKYRLVFADLAAAGAIREHRELNDAVAALVANGKRVKDLYRPVYDILKTLTGALPGEGFAPLKALAAIGHFDLFVSTTPDDLLARAIDAVRFGGAPQTHQIEYAPKLPTGRGGDIPEVPSSQYATVFYLFGKADASPF